MFKNSVIYIISGAINALIPILLMPYLTNNLKPDEYGMINLFSIVQMFLIPIIGFSTNAAISRQYFNTSINFPKYVWNCIILLVISAVLVGVCFLVFTSFIISITNLTLFWLGLLLITSVAQNLFMMRLAIFQVSEKAILFSLFQFLHVILNISFTYFFISYYKLGKDGRLYAIVIALILASCLSVYSLFKEKLIICKIDNNYLKDALYYSSPLILHTIGGIIMGMSDRFLISKYISLEATGIYSVAFQFAAGINLITTGINNAFVPWLFTKLKDESFDKRIIVKYTYFYYLFLFGIFIIFIAFRQLINKLLLLFISIDYKESLDLIPLLLLACIFNAMYLSVTNYIFYVKKTFFLSIVTITVGIINVLLSYSLIGVYGIFGAAISMCLSFFLLFATVFIISDRVFPMPWFFGFKAITSENGN